VGANLSWQPNAFHTFELGYIRTLNNTILLKGPPSSLNFDVYSFRNQYDDAVDVRWTGVFSPRKNGFLYKTKVRCAYDYHVEATLVQLDFTYKPFMAFGFFARADLFGGENKGTTDVYNNLIVHYLDNDRFQVGVQYAF
jgi:hypothetical protein